MNLRYLISMFFRLSRCKLEAGAKLSMSARLINMSKDALNIKIGADSYVKGELLVFPHGGKISIGEWCYIGEGTRIWSGKTIEIGNRVMVSHNINIFDNLTHSLSARLRHRHFYHIATVGHPKSIDLGERAVKICDDAWIAAGATILRGVTVGRGAIVGAGAVVTKDVEPWTVVGGNPAKVIRHLDPEEGIGLP